MVIFRSIPLNVCRGLLRLYIVVAVPWTLWFGYQLLDALNRYRSQRYVTDIFWKMIAVPAGAPIIFFVAIWIIAGFRRSAADHEQARAVSIADFKGVIGRAVSQLAENTPEARQTIYERARAALLGELIGQNEPTSHISHQSRLLELAIREIESSSPKLFRFQRRASTTLLIVALLCFPGLWALDFTSMSLYWVARLPKAPGQDTVRLS